MKSEANYHTNRLMQIETEMARLEEEKQYHLKRLEKLQEELNILDQSLEVFHGV